MAGQIALGAGVLSPEWRYNIAISHSGPHFNRAGGIQNVTLVCSPKIVSFPIRREEAG
ncbi:hypothetical protein DmAi_18540 [Acetobacter persici]|uniref:Uncharacterized protein n=1 Tax=Acetobacter persici TaxID=1076596 RepID=A0A6V8IEP9_9PROT|nr:hypothetical protein DmAi_18540 [Acetobacter persici]